MQRGAFCKFLAMTFVSDSCELLGAAEHRYTGYGRSETAMVRTGATRGTDQLPARFEQGFPHDIFTIHSTDLLDPLRFEIVTIEMERMQRMNVRKPTSSRNLPIDDTAGDGVMPHCVSSHLHLNGQ
jgi:hypothetical protein